MLYKPVPSILRRFKRYLERMVVSKEPIDYLTRLVVKNEPIDHETRFVVTKEPIDPKHCQGKWLEICEHVEVG